MDELLAAADAAAPDRYRESMRRLGSDLGERLREFLPREGDVLVVTTVEDADFLGRGVVDALAVGDRLKIFCYWNERDAARDVAPIISKYEEPLDEPRVTAVVVVKSIISGACVVRTNIIEALDKLHHSVPVFVVAPVMHVDARKKLRREFPTDVADRFKYVVCALDTEKDGEMIRPGIGGSVYELLGLGDKHTKNRVRPRIVAERRRVG
jgi:hypothetical protein